MADTKLNDRVKELMLEAGYAAPELAGRAQKLTGLIIEECRNIISEVYRETPLESCGYLIRADEEIAQKLTKIK